VICRLFLAFTLLLGGGCAPLFLAPPDPGREDLHIVTGVPFRAQAAEDDCGPAALASLLAHRGMDLPVEEITRHVYTPALRGSLLPDMENYARGQGFTTRSGRGDLALLREAVTSGRPVLIPMETGTMALSRPHYVVVFGYDSQGFLVHAGVRENVFINSGALLSRWEKMNRLFLFLE
jgi:ABC-type bacteriocin/lantibiotic exporter with double-glycine peptidase domain